MAFAIWRNGIATHEEQSARREDKQFFDVFHDLTFLLKSTRAMLLFEAKERNLLPSKKRVLRSFYIEKRPIARPLGLLAIQG